jgi:ADP-heptose:LPS heptosyltransferase
MAENKTFMLTLGGGLGDVFWYYLDGHNGWDRLEALKEKYPDSKVKVFSSTHNPQVEELLKYNPHIYKVKEYGWVLDGNSLWRRHKKKYTKVKTLKNLEKRKNKVYLSDKDNEQINKIISKGPFILIHPFAGERQRMCLEANDFIPIIDSLITKTKLNIVVLGGTYTRKNKNSSYQMRESFLYEREGLINLVNKTNARVGAVLASKQHSFVGCWSAYSCASWIYNKPSTIIVPKNWARIFRKNKQAEGGRWANKEVNIVSINGDLFHKNIKEIDLSQITKQILINY